MAGAEKRVLLIRFGPIGNALVAVPAVRALRRAWPEARISLAADPLTMELMSPCPYLDEIIRYDSSGPEKAGPGYARFIMALRKRRFTHAVHFRRYLRSELIGFFSGAPVRVGFETEARLQFLTHRVEYEEGGSVIEQNLKLVRALGVPASDARLEYWPRRESGRVDSIVAGARGAGPLVAVHPAGATQSSNLWPGFPELSRLMREKLDARVVMMGAEAERETVEAAAKALTPPAAAAIGFPLPEAAELIRRADLFAGTDSGPAHLADAVGTPGAVIYAPHRRMADQLSKWKPGGPHFLAFTPPRDCEDCGEHPCSEQRRRECAAKIDPAEVARGLEKLYSGKGF